MVTTTYLEKRTELETYFDRTASDAWEKLTSDAPVSRIRATVRAGRDEMRETLLGWLPDDLHDRRILDAGCGAGQFAIAAARRGADVVAIDLSETLTDLARERAATTALAGTLTFQVGDMFNPELGAFDHIVAMDSVIHYDSSDIAKILEGFASRARKSILFTVAPRTPALTVMHLMGRLFPRSDRAPAIQPVSETELRKQISDRIGAKGWRLARARTIKSGFYFSQAVELVRS